MTKLTGAALERAVANAMGLKSVNNCEKWGTNMKEHFCPAEQSTITYQDKCNWCGEREALAQTQEPAATVESVATVVSESGNQEVTMSWWHEPALPVGTKLYTTPPQRTWVGLTDEEMTHTNHHMVEGAYQYSFKQGALWAEAKLKEKNT